MPVHDLYLLALIEPYDDPAHPVPLNTLVVHAATLLHPFVPQPDGGMVYRCLTEFPHRSPGEVVPISTLTFELDGGRLWPHVADWEKVVDALLALARGKGCDAVQLGVCHVDRLLLAGGPTSTQIVMSAEDGRQAHYGPADRQQVLADIAQHAHDFAAEQPFWPGEGLVAPPAQPARLPYWPHSWNQTAASSRVGA